MFSSVPGKDSRKQRAQKAVEKAKSVHEGKLEISDCQLLDYDLDVLLKSLGHAPEVREIRLTGTYLGDGSMPRLVEIINQCPNLETLIIYENKITEAGLQILADRVQNHPGLHAVTINNNAIGPGGGKPVAELLSNNSITSFKLSSNQLGDTDAAAIAKALETNRTLHELHLSHNNFTDEGAIIIAESLQHNRTLNKLMLHGITLEARDQIGETLIKTGHPSLIEIYPTCDDSSFVTAENREESYVAARRLEAGIHGLSLAETHSIYHRQTILKHCYGKHTYRLLGIDKDTVLANLETFINSLPDLPVSGLDMESLFQANANGYAVIENPKNWENPETLFATLDDAAIPITKELLEKQTPRGNSFAAVAFAFAPLDEVMTQLNRRGIQLHCTELLEEDGTPNALLAQAVERGQAKALFQTENWLGASRGELLGVLHALPEETQAQITNRHSLLASIRAGQAMERS